MGVGLNHFFRTVLLNLNCASLPFLLKTKVLSETSWILHICCSCCFCCFVIFTSNKPILDLWRRKPWKTEYPFVEAPLCCSKKKTLLCFVWSAGLEWPYVRLLLEFYWPSYGPVHLCAHWYVSIIQYFPAIYETRENLIYNEYILAIHWGIALSSASDRDRGNI